MRLVDLLLTALKQRAVLCLRAVFCLRGYGGCLSHQLCTHQVVIQMFLLRSNKIGVCLRTLKRYVVD